ncbi:MAG: ABC transporter permease [Lachnospiraceae bacterium]|nr:ABC transporter permease [Lachnospiraceae bacterium]
MNSYIELGNKYVTRKKMRSLLVIISMVLASMLIYVVVAAGMGTFMHAKGVEEAWANYYVGYYNLSDEQYDIVKNYANVESCARGGLVGPKLIGVDNDRNVLVEPKNYYTWYNFRLMEMETFDQDIFADTLLEGRLPENSSEIMLCEADVHRFTEEVKLGDTIVMHFIDAEGSDDDVPQKEATKEYVFCGIYKSEGEDSWNACSGYTLADDMTGLTTYVRFKRKYHWRADADALADSIQAKIDRWGKKYYFNDPLDMYYFQNDQVFILGILLTMFAVLLIYFCMVMVRSLMSVNVINKLKDYTVLKSMGATNKQLRKIMMRENLVQGCIAFVTGVVSGQLFLSLFLVRYCELYSLSFRYIWMALLANALFLWLTIELASIEPFFMLKKVSIVEALGQRELIKHSKRKKKPGLLYRKLSIEGQYAYKNMKRNRKSFWNSVAAFTISVLIITTMMATLTNAGISIEADEMMSIFPGAVEYAYDITVPLSYSETGNADYGKIEQARQALEAREDVLAADYAAGCLVAQDVANGLQLKQEVINALNWSPSTDALLELCFLSESQLKRLNEYMMDGVDACEAVKDGGVIVLGYADLNGQKDVPFYNLKVGDRIAFGSLEVISEIDKENEKRGGIGSDGYVSSFKEVRDKKAYEQYIIKGFCKVNNQISDFPRTVVMSYEYVKETYGEDFIKNQIGSINVNIDEKTFDKAAFENVVGTQPALLSWNYTDIKKMIAEETRIMQYIGIFIVAFIVILGVVSMLNTMINEQIQRKKENAILRAIGMSRSGLNKMLIMEKMLVGFMAWFIGTVLSIVLSYVFTIGFRYMTEAKFVFPWYICGITAAVLFVIMAVLSWLMIIMVGKMDITEGIRNEG